MASKDRQPDRQRTEPVNPPRPIDPDALRRATARAGKTYAFDEAYDPSRPVDWWFQESTEGLVLFLVFYSQACRWSLRTGCTFPSTSVFTARGPSTP